MCLFKSSKLLNSYVDHVPCAGVSFLSRGRPNGQFLLPQPDIVQSKIFCLWLVSNYPVKAAITPQSAAGRTTWTAARRTSSITSTTASTSPRPRPATSPRPSSPPSQSGSRWEPQELLSNGQCGYNDLMLLYWKWESGKWQTNRPTR